MKLLSQLHIQSKNSGANYGINKWSNTKDQGEIISYNPTNAEPIASIYKPSLADYESVLDAATKAFISWREIPAPKRGELIRAIGDELRQHKDQLGSLVSLEMGKSKQEGDGEV